MKRCALLIILVLAAPAAQAQWNLDNIGLYLAPSVPDSYCKPNGPVDTYRIYVLGTNVTSPNVKGLEFKLSHTGPVLVGPLMFPPGIDFGGRVDEHTIAYYDPQPVGSDGQFIFAEYDLFVTDMSTPAYGFISGIYFHSLPAELPAYLDGDDLNLIKPLFNITGDVFQPDLNVPVLIFNGDCSSVVPNEDASWGEVKALYR